MKPRKRTIGELFEDRKLMDAAVRRAVREAVASNPSRSKKPAARTKRARRAA
jgi:hypothetical protein